MTEDRADHDASTPEAPRAPTEPRLPNEPAAAATLDTREDAMGADPTVGRAESLRDYLPSVSLPSVSLPSFGVRRRRRLRSPATRLQVPVWELGLLVVILLLGAYFRFVGLNWDNGQHLHPDERFLTMVEGAIRPGLANVTVSSGGATQAAGYQPAGLLESYFDTTRSTLNPHNVGYGFFVYGTFPLFFVRWLGGALSSIGYDKVHLLGRALSGISDLITVLLTCLIGRRLYGPRVGLLAAALLAACVMHIQQAHFFVFDSFLVTLIVAAFYYCVDIAETGRWRSFALAGIFLGLALATKLSMVVFAPIVALAGVIYLWHRGLAEHGAGVEGLRTLWTRGLLARIVGGGVLTLLIAAVMFRIFQPYAFQGPHLWDLHLNPKWLDNIAYQAKSQDGTVDLPPSIQWANTAPLLFPWRHMVAWGFGIPLGVAAWIGFAAACAVVLWRGSWRHLLVLAWAGLCFVYFASVLNKTMRYILPAYPFFILLGAWFLVAFYDLSRRYSRTMSRIALALGAVVVLASVGWSFAFTRIYTRPTTRVAASLWIYQNLPKGTVMVNEHWDDPIPVPIPPYNPGDYRGPHMQPDSMPMYDPDEPKKIDNVVQLLTMSDFINVTSNRLYASIPRIPQRYPMSSEYYRRLFAGDLGFKLVKTFASYPQLGPWVIGDDRAEEAFTVYDHPKVLLFQKQPDFSAEKVRAMLSAVPLDNVVQIKPIEAGKPNGMLPADLRAADRAGGTWAESFNYDGLENKLSPLLWWLALEAMGLLAAPIVWRLFVHVPDRGYGLTKILGLLGISWIGWTLSSYRLLPWTRLCVLVAISVFAVASWLALRRHGAAWLDWLRDHRRLLLASEAVFLAAFVAFTVIRALNPDLWHPGRGGEKPMEFSYLNAVIKTTYFPPYDPWLAGGYLNYYYFGYVLVAALTKLTGVVPAISFNLAVSTLYALTAAGAFSFAYNLSRLGGRPRLPFRAAVAAGIAGWALLCIAGNLDGFMQLLERLARAGHVGMTSAFPGVAGLTTLLVGIPATLFSGRALEPFDFWRSSRVIPNNTINEFPFWTFLFSDLHAHLISIPFQVAGLGWLLNLAYSGKRALRVEDAGVVAADPLSLLPGEEGPLRWMWPLFGWRRIVEIVVTAWLLGALYVINTWEFPTYLLLAAAIFVIAEFVAQRGLTIGGLARAVVSVGAVFVLAKPLYGPFWRFYMTFYQSVTPWTIDKSRLDHYLIIHGVFVFSLVAMIVMLGMPVWRQTGSVRYLLARWRWLGAWDRFAELEETFGVRREAPATGYLALLAISAALVLGLLLRGLPLVAVLCALIAGCIAVAWERRDSPALLLACLLGATGCALGAFVEFYTLQGDIGRMNTVFKFYLQVWVMWSLVSAAALVWAADRILAPLFTRAPLASPESKAPSAPLLFEEPAFAGVGDGDASFAEAPAPPHTYVLPVEHADSSLITRHSSLPWWGWAWLAGAAALLLAALAYPLGATPARIADRFRPLPPTLDGMAYMQYATVQDGSSEVIAANPGGATIRAFNDYAAIRWLQDTVKGSPVILEASIPEYRWGTRVAKYTGLPAVLGWRWHQAQQRGTYAPQVDQRLREVQTMFNDPSPSRLLPLLEKYQVRYIYIGDLERAYYSAAGIAKFGQMPDALRPVYDQNGVTIYEVTVPATRAG